MTALLTTRHCLLVLSLSLVLFSCKQKQSAATQSPSKVLTADNLEAQSFTIQANRDTILKGKSGTVLRIYKNTFTDNTGKPASGDIHIELKEALQPIDILSSGLTTTSDGHLLETGGMIYVNATANEQVLQIAGDKSIGVIVPSKKVKKGMSIFQGVQDSTGINWKNPVPVLNEALAPKPSPQVTRMDTTGEPTKVSRESDIDAILGYVDSVKVEPGRKPANKKKMKAIRQPLPAQPSNSTFLDEIQRDKGVNNFAVDDRIDYIFSLKNLGWANIDRLYNDPRRQEVDFVTVISNQKEFPTIYITLIISNQGMYLPGYQRKDDTFCFTHGDTEATQLPVGETATILATAYKDDIPWYSIKTVTITHKQKIVLQLQPTTEAKLKETLTKQIVTADPVKQNDDE